MASAFTYERYGHLFPGIDKSAAASSTGCGAVALLEMRKKSGCRESMALLWQ
jgi:hypothetical protein